MPIASVMSSDDHHADRQPGIDRTTDIRALKRSQCIRGLPKTANAPVERK